MERKRILLPRVLGGTSHERRGTREKRGWDWSQDSAEAPGAGMGASTSGMTPAEWRGCRLAFAGLRTDDAARPRGSRGWRQGEPRIFEGAYDPGRFFDEMFEAPGEVRARTTARSTSELAGLSREGFDERRREADIQFLYQGITFTVYSRGRGHRSGSSRSTSCPRMIPRARVGAARARASSSASPPSTCSWPTSTTSSASSARA